MATRPTLHVCDLKVLRLLDVERHEGQAREGALVARVLAQERSFRCILSGRWSSGKVAFKLQR